MFRCSHMFKDISRCSQIFLNVLSMFCRCSLDEDESTDINHPKEFDDPQVFDDSKETSIGSMDFDNPKVYGVSSMFDVLVYFTSVSVGFWPRGLITVISSFYYHYFSFITFTYISSSILFIVGHLHEQESHLQQGRMKLRTNFC